MGLDVLVTVGMGPWPFDRLIGTLGPVCRQHRVFAQTGTSSIEPPCAHASFLPYTDLLRRLEEADVVITHAGNTVRLVQRAGKVPIAIAREHRFHEMGNDHQVEYLRHEAVTGRVVAVDDVDDLAVAVAAHPQVEQLILNERPPPPDLDGEDLADRLDRLCQDLLAPRRRRSLSGYRPGPPRR